MGFMSSATTKSNMDHASKAQPSGAYDLWFRIQAGVRTDGLGLKV